MTCVARSCDGLAPPRSDILNARQTLQWPRVVLFSLSALLLLALLAWQLRAIHASMPYPQHGDEKVVMVGAQRILETGDWDSRVYAYGSLPIYLDTLCLGLGVIMKSGQGPHALEVKRVGRLFGSFYEQPAVAVVARNTWALFGTACILLCGLTAYRIGGAPAMLLAILCFGLGESVRAVAARYVNVDIPMCLFACWLLFYLTSSRPSHSWSVLPAALLTGATIASKYTGFVVLAPCLLWIWLYADRPMLRSGQLLAFSAFAFLCFCPYFLFRFPQFIDAIAAENFHYRVRGHRGFDVSPGLPQV
ncbi:MAG TPA: glycosyltransferase family 39 protein, partial [Polyangiales bacterium]